MAAQRVERVVARHPPLRPRQEAVVPDRRRLLLRGGVVQLGAALFPHEREVLPRARRDAQLLIDGIDVVVTKE